MMEPSKWDWADSIGGFILGILGGIMSLFGWFSGRIGKVHDRINEVTGRVNENRDLMSQQNANIKVLDAHREASEQRLGYMENALQEINRKQDRQMEVLMELHKRK